MRLGEWVSGLRERFAKGESCLACGRCCEEYGRYLHASDNDVLRWKDLGRDDILSYVGEEGGLWVDPESGTRGGLCPYLIRVSDEEVHCAIHTIKPDVCRAYPTIHHDHLCIRGFYHGP